VPILVILDVKIFILYLGGLGGNDLIVSLLFGWKVIGHSSHNCLLSFFGFLSRFEFVCIPSKFRVQVALQFMVEKGGVF